MIELPTKRLKSGMVAAQTVFNSSGANYITRGTTLTQQYIDRLRQLGVEGIHVTSTDTNAPLPPPEDILSEKTRVFAVKRVCHVFEQVTRNGVFDLEPLSQASAAIINDIMSRKGNLVQLTEIRLHDMYTFAHSVNVAMLASMQGVLLGMDKKELSELTLGGLLHDLGKLVVPSDVLNNPGRLTDEEFAIIKKHPTAGVEKIMKLKVPDTDRLSIVASQHHEKMNGKGYPKGRAGKAIHLYGRIGAIADVYDALTSVRPYKKAYTPIIAYNIMTNCSPGQFDEELLKLFFSNVALYPVGTVMKTSMGYAIVKDMEFGKTGRPVVIVFADLYGHMNAEPEQVDLSVADDVRIDNVINDVELFHFIHEIGFDPAALLIA